MNNETKSSVPPSTVAPKLALPIRLIDGASSITNFLAAAGLSLLALNVFVDVIVRTFFNRSFPGTIDMTIYWWMPTLTLLAFGYTERVQEHIKVTVLLDALPLRLREIIEGVFSLLAAILLATMSWYTWIDAARSAEIKEATSSAPPIQFWPFKFVAVVGVAMLSLQLLATSYRHFAGKKLVDHHIDAEEQAL